MSRQYLFVASRPGGPSNWPGQPAESAARIREVTIVLFRRWYGREPTGHWHKDGFMAEAWDRRGNRLAVEQVNEAPAVN